MKRSVITGSYNPKKITIPVPTPKVTIAPGFAFSFAPSFVPRVTKVSLFTMIPHLKISKYHVVLHLEIPKYHYLR